VTLRRALIVVALLAVYLAGVVFGCSTETLEAECRPSAKMGLFSGLN